MIRVAMTLRTKILLYLVAIHALLGAVAVGTLWDRRIWLLLAEAGFVVSLIVGWKLMREFFVPLDLIETGTELMRERDFTIHFREVGQPEMDRLIGVYNRMVDQLREERQKLAEQHLLLDKILAVSPSGILTLDFDGCVTLANPASGRMLGGRSDFAGRRLEALDSPVAPELAAVPIGESRVLALPGGRRVRARRTRFRDRGFERSFLLIEELTEELRESERAAYGKVIRMMSHEVKNSVGAVRSLLDSCSDLARQLDPSDREDFRRALQVAADRLSSLDGFMNGFADVVRLPDPECRPCDLSRLVTDLQALHGPELERRRIAFDLDCPEAVSVEADKNQLEQVLVNVLRNAMESIGTDGRIAVSLRRDADGAHLTVADDGAGIAETVRPQLFAPFFTTKPDGRGIGLTVIREVLVRHGFPFALEPRPPRGAEFRVEFPGALRR